MTFQNEIFRAFYFIFHQHMLTLLLETLFLCLMMHMRGTLNFLKNLRPLIVELMP